MSLGGITMIIREKYLKKIRPFYNQDLIKVITGIRRSGKSVILKQIINEIKESGVKEENIITPTLCSKCNTNIHSYRRDGNNSGRNIALICMMES